MTTTTPLPTGINCAQPECGQPLGRWQHDGMWVHIDPNGNGWHRNCAGGRSGNQAKVPDLAVAHLTHYDLSESFHAVVDHGEYTVWFDAQRRLWSAWKLEPPLRGRPPAVAVYDPSEAFDPRPQLDRMPPLVRHWMAEAIYPF